MASMPRCNKHTDCFALSDEGRCVCLAENDFGKKGLSVL